MKNRIAYNVLFLTWLLLGQVVLAQESFDELLPYQDYLGAGHDVNITVTSSDADDANGNGDGSVTVNGFNLNNPAQLSDAARFLQQATLGADLNMIKMTAAMGYEAWLDEQMALPMNPVLYTQYRIYGQLNGGDSEGDVLNEPIFRHFFRSAWWQNQSTAPDLLRHRLNYNLSEIFVISDNSDFFEDHSQVLASFYDLLGGHCFGNYRDMLYDISLNPGMGVYLSHYNNPKSDPDNNIHPDENYAREIMQLFSIGLFELNNDGTWKLDAEGNPIPTYDNGDIKEFAKVFTGMGSGAPGGEFGLGGEEAGAYQLIVPMKMYEEWHEPGEKQLLNGYVIPDGQTGLEDISDCIDHLSAHDNVGPFMAKHLIKFMVTSNPSPEYVGRVADAFNDNGEGMRGDMSAVVRAVLLDEEARTCTAVNDSTYGRLREPITRYANLLNAFNAYPKPQGVDEEEEEEFESEFAPAFFSTMDYFKSATGQAPMAAPSVFNFFMPEYQPNGEVSDLEMVAPEFQIHNSSTAIGFINLLDDWTLWQHYLPYDVDGSFVDLDLSYEYSLAEDPTALVDHLSLVMAAGQLSDATKEIIVTALNGLTAEEYAGEPEELVVDRVAIALYLVMCSPDYAIQK